MSASARSSSTPLAAAAPAAALVLTTDRQTSTKIADTDTAPDLRGRGCPDRDPSLWFVNVETGQVVPSRCGRNGCAYCLPVNAGKRIDAVVLMQPRRTITITNLAKCDDPDPWQEVRRKVNRTREFLKKAKVDPGLWGIFVEKGKETGMVHAHIVQNGEKRIPKEALSDAASSAGCGWTRVEAVRNSGKISDYVGKGFGISRYVGKSFSEGEGDPLAALRLNGGRIGHFSRGFFRDPSSGAIIGVREAEKIAATLRRNGEGSKWRPVMCTESAAIAYGRALVPPASGSAPASG